MARIQVMLPETYCFRATVSVRITDLNYGNHVGNDRILSLMHEARMQFLQWLGYKSEVSIDDHTGIIISDVAIVYKSEAFYGDVLDVLVTPYDLNKYGFDLAYRLVNNKTQKDVAHGKTGIVCFDYVKRKVALLPDHLKNKLTDSSQSTVHSPR